MNHKLMGMLDSENISMYESEMVSAIAESANKDMDLLYVPVAQTEAPELLLRAIKYASEEGVLVFDKEGALFQ